MEAFTKIVRLGRQKNVGSTFCKIEFDGTRLSISGVEGPLPSGNARGGCGQIDMHADTWQFVEYAPGWTAESVARFLALWGARPLIDVRAYDAAMKRDGWHHIAKREVFGHEFTLSSVSSDAKRAAERSATEALRKGETFTPTAEQVAAAVRPYSITMWTDSVDRPAAPDGYEPARHFGGHRSGDVKQPDRKTLGWLRPSEHPDGLLTRKHPKSGNGYGSGWYREDVPVDVLEWLVSLPDTDVKPAWV